LKLKFLQKDGVYITIILDRIAAEIIYRPRRSRMSFVRNYAQVHNDYLLFWYLFRGQVIGIVYNKFIIKDYPDYKRKFGYFITVAIFILFTISLFGILILKSGLNSTTRDYSTKLEHYVKINYSDNEFVRNGLDRKNINNGISK
jgi:hypothetical protein